MVLYMNNHFREQGKFRRGNQKLHFYVGVIHNFLLTFLMNQSGESYNFCAQPELGGKCQIGFMTKKLREFSK